MMTRVRKTLSRPLIEKYPPSRPCSCEICRGYCARPGWWMVEEAERVIAAGYAGRMMLEMSPELTFGVLSPAFKGCEGSFAAQGLANRSCTFYHHERCELFRTGLQPLECRFCHHDRPGRGIQCHADLERDWDTPDGCGLVVRWSKLTGFWERMVLGRRR